MLRRVTLFVLLCIAASALAPPLHGGAGDRRAGKRIAGLAYQGQVVEMRASRRDRNAWSHRIPSAVWLHTAADRPLGHTKAARPVHRSRSVTTLPSYHVATHLSL